MAWLASRLASALSSCSMAKPICSASWSNRRDCGLPSLMRSSVNSRVNARILASGCQSENLFVGAISAEDAENSAVSEARV